MRTNTSRVMTAFSDLPHPPGTPLPHGTEQIGAYLRRYAEQMGVLADARFRTRVDEVPTLTPAGNGWVVRATQADYRTWEERFDHVVGATGTGTACRRYRRSRAGQLHRQRRHGPCRARLPRRRPVSRAARPGRRAQHQRPGDRQRAGAARSGSRRGHGA
ncbi:MAG: hypothetical protein H6559_20760 [Lewinellaceae bacterium]|nr:hypothetical protein [Lewinellaceae bacterium]